MVWKKQKVMHNLCGRPMLGWVMRSVQQHITERPIVVLGFDGESAKDYFGKDCHLRLSAERAGQQGGCPQGRHAAG